MQEHFFSTPRTARYFTLGSPQGATDVWFVCHGYGQLASRFLERFRALESERRCIVAPEGLSRFYLTENPSERRVGASWMTREDRVHEIDDYVRFLDALHAQVVPGNAVGLAPYVWDPHPPEAGARPGAPPGQPGPGRARARGPPWAPSRACRCPM